MIALPPPIAADLLPKRVILASTEADAIVASLMVARGSSLPVRRIYAPELALADALAHPVALRLEAGELVLVGFAPLPDQLAVLWRFLADRPGLSIEVVDHHLWPAEERERLLGCMGNRRPRIRPDTWHLAPLAAETDGGDVVAQRLIGLVTGTDTTDGGTGWREVLLSLWNDPTSVPAATVRLLESADAIPDSTDRAQGAATEALTAELAGSPFHRFPLATGEGILIVHPAHPPAPAREVAARARERTGAQASLTCFDGRRSALFEFGRPPLGRLVPDRPLPDARVVAAECRRLVPSSIAVLPLDRGTVWLRAHDAPFPLMAADVIPRLAHLPLDPDISPTTGF